MYYLTRRVKVMSTGLFRDAGKTISRREVPSAIFDRWLTDGVVTEVAPEPEPEPRVAERDESVPLTLPAHVYPEPELRELAQELGIAHYWNKSVARLIDEVDAARK